MGHEMEHWSSSMGGNGMGVSALQDCMTGMAWHGLDWVRVDCSSVGDWLQDSQKCCYYQS